MLYGVSAVRLILIPLVTLALLSLLPAAYMEMKMAILIAAACPVGSNVAVYAHLHDRNYPYAVETVVISTILSPDIHTASDGSGPDGLVDIRQYGFVKRRYSRRTVASMMKNHRCGSPFLFYHSCLSQVQITLTRSRFRIPLLHEAQRPSGLGIGVAVDSDHADFTGSVVLFPS